ncbi:MAG: hypothetical protein WAO91_02725 [Candidatus Nitrosotenuis sp.]
MDEEDRNFQIEEMAQSFVKDKISLDEQDPAKLQKYIDYAKTKFHISNEESVQLINEAFLYLKLKNANDYDPLQEADKFGAGFS